MHIGGWWVVNTRRRHGRQVEEVRRSPPLIPVIPRHGLLQLLLLRGRRVRLVHQRRVAVEQGDQPLPTLGESPCRDFGQHCLKRPTSRTNEDM